MKKIGVSVFGAEAVAQALRALRDKGANLRPFFEVAAADLEESTKLRFTDGRDPNGVPWKPLSRVTLIRRAENASGGRALTPKRKRASARYARALLGGAQPLLDTGRLRNSITSRASAREAVVGTNVEYAPTHQYGAKKGKYGRTRRGAPIPWGKVPARPFFGISREDSDLVLQRIREHLIGPR